MFNPRLEAIPEDQTLNIPQGFAEEGLDEPLPAELSREMEPSALLQKSERVL